MDSGSRLGTNQFIAGYNSKSHNPQMIMAAFTKHLGETFALGLA
jgi:hypothetical protein